METIEKGTTITNNTFVGVQWDAQAIESVNMVAKGLLNLTELFRTQNINIEAMLKVDGEKLLEAGKLNPDDYRSNESNNNQL